MLVAFDAGGENLFGVDASLSVSTDLTAPCTALVIASSYATFATRHNSAFLNLIKKSNASRILGC